MKTMYDFNKVINRNNTFSIQNDFTKLRYGQAGLLSFGISDMDFQAPPEILATLKQRVEHGVFGYSGWDCPEYKSSITTWYKQRFNYNLDCSLITYSPNVSYALSNLIKIFNPKHEPVTLFSPSYNGFFNMLSLNKIAWYSIPIVYCNKQYVIDYSALEENCRKSKVLLLCNPNNPNGKVWQTEELTKIVEICKRYNVFIVSDEMYMDFTHPPFSFTSLLQVAEPLDYINNTAVITSASKTFNTPGLGGAYTIINNSNIRNTFFELLKNQDNFIFAMALSIPCLITGYNNCATWVDAVNEYIMENLNFTKQFFHKNLPLLHFEIPHSGYFAWINCKNLNLTNQEIQNKLMANGLGIPSGESYQEPTPYLRLNVGCPRAKLELGLKKILNAFS